MTKERNILLETPPAKLSLDDSNFFEDRYKDYRNEIQRNPMYENFDESMEDNILDQGMYSFIIFNKILKTGLNFSC